MVNTCSVETAIAGKIDGILSLMGFAGQMKDYYDIYYNIFTAAQSEQVMAFDDEEAMQKKWKAFYRVFCFFQHLQKLYLHL